MAVEHITPEWFGWPQVKRVLNLLDKAGVEACFVGGCVRDALIGKPPRDFDIVTTAPLKTVHDILQRAGIESEIFASSFGPVRTAIDGIEFDFLYVHEHCPPGLPFKEIVKRYCEGVDLTINALYLFPSGELHDNCGGREDLKEGRIRFLKDTDAAIKIARKKVQAIRYFRFLAWFGKGEPDPESLKACLTRAADILEVDFESAQREGIKLLSAPHPHAVLELMHRHNALKYAVGFTINDCSLLNELEYIERLRDEPSAWQVRLTLLFLSTFLSPEEALDHLVAFWQLDDTQKQELALLLEYMIAADADMTAETRKELVAQLGKETVRNLLLIRWALEENIKAASERYKNAIAAIH